MADTPEKSSILVDVFSDLIRHDANALEMKIGQHGFVQLIDCMPRLVPGGSIGVESAIINAARVSYSSAKVRSTDLGLLGYLMRNEHMSPFEMVEFTWLVSCEIFTARQIFRHRTACFNEQSARYSELEECYYEVASDDVRAQSAINKQGSSRDTSVSPEGRDRFSRGLREVNIQAAAVYRQALVDGVAREQARAVLPVGTFTRFYFKQNLRNLFHFLELRMDSHAQAEIQAYAVAMYSILHKVIPHAMRLFDVYLRGSIRLSSLEVRALRDGKVPENMTPAEIKEWEAKKASLHLSSTGAI